MKIIGIAGPIGSGKSTLADHLIAKHGYVRVDFAAAIKAEIIQHCRKTLIAHIRDHFPWSRDYDHKDPKFDIHINFVMFIERTPLTRALQQEWGMMRRAQDPDYWVRAWKERLAALGNVQVVNDNVRFENEARAIRAMNGLLVKVERPKLETPALAADDPTERGLTDWKDWDAVIVNGGSLNDLHSSGDSLVLKTATMAV